MGQTFEGTTAAAAEGGGGDSASLPLSANPFEPPVSAVALGRIAAERLSAASATGVPPPRRKLLPAALGVRAWAAGGAGRLFAVGIGALASVAAAGASSRVLRSSGPEGQLLLLLLAALLPFSTTAAANRRGRLRPCTAVSVTEGRGAVTAPAAAAAAAVTLSRSLPTPAAAAAPSCPMLARLLVMYCCR